MTEIVSKKLESLSRLCDEFEVERLELFGSAARSEFDANRSDLDFLVLFRRNGKLGAADRFLGLLIKLEDLFGRKIDLIDIRAARNPYFVAKALQNRVLLYAA
jgi:hypothetical protein